MTNRIKAIAVRSHSLAPISAEAWVTVTPQHCDAATEIRGRLSGPRSAYSTTVEVPYPLQPLGPAAASQQSAVGLTRRVVVPEPSFWDAQNPFLYEGPVELWQDGVCCDRVYVRHGFRSLGLNRNGLHVNGRLLTLRGCRVANLDADAIRRLRDQRFNLVVLGASVSGSAGWGKADQLGIHVLAELSHEAEKALAQADDLASHACALGFLIPADAGWIDRLPSGLLIGTQLKGPPAGPLSERLHFVTGSGELAAIGRPLLLQNPPPSPPTGVVVLGTLQG